VLLYAYCLGVRSSRQIQRRCHEDIAFRVLAANQCPDHVTIARFRVRHEHALARFLVTSLELCAAAGMVRVGMVALDGTKVAANAADKANRTRGQLTDEVAQILRQAAETDTREDREHGQARGDELPAALASPTGRLTRLRAAKARLDTEAAGREQAYQQRVAASPTRPRWPPARRRARSSAGRRRPPPPTPAPTSPTLTAASCMAARARCRATTPRPLRPSISWSWPPRSPSRPTTSASSPHAPSDGCHANCRRDPRPDLGTIGRLRLLVDRQPHRDPRRPELLIPPAKHARQGKPRKDGKPSASNSDGLRAAMTAKLASDEGKARYALRRQTVEPVFGQIKEHRGARRFLRRGLAACDAEWKLLCATNDLLKLWRHTTASTT
jgi:hypothetical protein